MGLLEPLPIDTKRGIKCPGGWAPPPMYTDEEIEEFLQEQNEVVAEAGMRSLNDSMASQGKAGFELVRILESAAFRTPEGTVFHGNFVAKPADDPNAGKRLFFAACKHGPDDDVDDLEAIDCHDLGLVEIAPTDSRPTCEMCDSFDEGSAIVHPSEAKIDHGCLLCGDSEELPCPIFHPAGYKIDHLFFPGQDPASRMADDLAHLRT